MSYVETQSNIEYLFVAKDISRAASAGTTIDSYSDLSDGELVWTTPGNVVVDTGASKDCADFTKLKLIQRSGTQLLVSDLIDVMSVKSYDITAYSATQEQIDFVGYNTSSGSTQAIDYNTYMLRLHFDNHRHRIIKHGVYKSSSSAAQNAIIDGITVSLEANMRPENGEDQLVKIERICSAAGTSNTSGDITVINGSKYITAVTDIDHNTVVIGDYYRLGATTTSGPLYKIVAINVGGAQVAELDIPYQGASGTVTDGNAEFVSAADAAAADWGIKLTGLPPTFTRGRSDYHKIGWDLELSDFGTTTETNTQGALLGTGTYGQVSEIEDFLQGNETAPFRQENRGPALTRRVDVLADDTYDLMRLEFADKMQSNLGPVNNSPKRIVIAIATTAAQAAAAATGIAVVADDWIVTSYLVPGITVQAGNLT